jgi:hypothetical protein
MPCSQRTNHKPFFFAGFGRLLRRFGCLGRKPSCVRVTLVRAPFLGLHIQAELVSTWTQTLGLTACRRLSAASSAACLGSGRGLDSAATAARAWPACGEGAELLTRVWPPECVSDFEQRLPILVDGGKMPNCVRFLIIYTIYTTYLATSPSPTLVHSPSLPSLYLKGISTGQDLALQFACWEPTPRQISLW